VTLIGAFIGAVSLSGSLIAWAKLDGVIKKPLRFTGQQVVNAAACWQPSSSAVIVFVALNGTGGPIAAPTFIYVFFACALIFGILMTLPIGGADMPVVISIYNAAPASRSGSKASSCRTRR
jgi:NAD(P) transhydrogenase subunit beta